MLARLRQREEERAALVGVGFDPDSWVFSDEPDGSRPWRPDVATARVTRLRNSVPGAAKLTIRSLRSYVATVLVDTDTDPRTAQGRLRHSQVTTTLTHYAARRRPAGVAAALRLGAASTSSRLAAVPACGGLLSAGRRR